MFFWKKKDNLIIGGTVIVFFVGLMVWQGYGSVLAASPALNVPFVDKDQKIHSLSEFKGKPFIAVFWATWCSACVNKMSVLNSFAKKFHDKGGSVIAISEDFNDMAKAQGYLTQHKYHNLPLFMDSTQDLMSSLGVEGLPTAIFFNAQGQEVWRRAGGLDWESADMQNTVKEYLGIQVWETGN